MFKVRNKDMHFLSSQERKKERKDKKESKNQINIVF